MKYSNLILTISLAMLLAACGNSTGKHGKQSMEAKEKSNIAYAKGFKMERYADYTKVTVRNPWDTTRIMETYILVDRNKQLTDNLPHVTVVKVPVKRVETCSSIFAGE
jgi:iron complex transport system substrate-binding protein